MRVNLQNIVGSAIERGIVEGYKRASYHAQFQQSPEQARAFIEQVFDCVQESLDHYIDFSDQISGEESRIGFKTDAVGSIHPSFSGDGDDENITIPLGAEKTLDSSPLMLYTTVRRLEKRNRS